MRTQAREARKHATIYKKRRGGDKDRPATDRTATGKWEVTHQGGLGGRRTGAGEKGKSGKEAVGRCVTARLELAGRGLIL